MSKVRPQRVLRDTADFLNDIAQLQPGFRERADLLSVGLRHLEQHQQASTQTEERLSDQLREAQKALADARLELRLVQARHQAAITHAERDIENLKRDLSVARQETHQQIPNSAPAPTSSSTEEAALQRELQQLRRKINSPRFWTGTFAETFAESLASMDAVHEALEVATEAEVTSVFAEWQQEITSGVELFAEAGFDADLAEHLRRLLICQWVYLRWQEVTSP